jgi:serine protease inhibitor
MKKFKLIIVYVLLTAQLSISISLYSIIGETEPLAENRLPKQLQPVELMVDATNHLGIKILNLHSQQNKNNIAFSPCGLMSILVALFEGSTGKSNIEIKEALGFPTERDIVRVGVRDIHRRLRVNIVSNIPENGREKERKKKFMLFILKNS